MSVPNAGHELMHRFTSRTRRLHRIKPKYGSPTVECHGLQLSKVAMFLQLEHVMQRYPRYFRQKVRIPSPANSSVKQKNRIDRGNRMIIVAFQVASTSSLVLRQAG
ncbi:hypothetical protein PIB30_062546 [Stylosanthes scabra]|uniref:Uncharacterized protein n=1 Tax=Stylosanthes scabra TaxID=79078 RepID=A0ABU6UL28_9FABA|nr:hypothetical protein [Stylosanthes scabra]